MDTQPDANEGVRRASKGADFSIMLVVEGRFFMARPSIP